MFVRVCPNDPGTSECANPVWMQYADINSFQISQLDLGSLFAAFSAGFVIVATAFAIGQAAGLLYRALN